MQNYLPVPDDAVQSISPDSASLLKFYSEADTFLYIVPSEIPEPPNDRVILIISRPRSDVPDPESYWQWASHDAEALEAAVESLGYDGPSTWAVIRKEQFDVTYRTTTSTSGLDKLSKEDEETVRRFLDLIVMDTVQVAIDDGPPFHRFKAITVIGGDSDRRIILWVDTDGSGRLAEEDDTD